MARWLPRFYCRKCKQQTKHDPHGIFATCRVCKTPALSVGRNAPPGASGGGGLPPLTSQAKE